MRGYRRRTDNIKENILFSIYYFFFGKLICILDYHKGKYILSSDMTHKTIVIVFLSDVFIKQVHSSCIGSYSYLYLFKNTKIPMVLYDA